MDLNILNSGTVETKNFLNPVCNTLTCDVLTCNNLVLARDVFNLYRTTVVAIPPTSVTAPCNLEGIPNPDMDLVTNVYTVPRDGYLSLSFSIVLNWAATSTSLVALVFIKVNGTSTYLYSNIRDDVLSASTGSFPLQISGIIPVNAGDLVGVELIFNGSGTGFSYSTATYSGQLL